jgi:hypothetical protein
MALARTVSEWMNTITLPPLSYTCGYCNRQSGSNVGYYTHFAHDAVNIRQVGEYESIYLCSYCARPTYIVFDANREKVLQFPGSVFGDQVRHLPDLINTLYNEARTCMSANAHTSAVLLCRKILMHVGVHFGANEGQGFVYYVNYLDQGTHIPRGARAWVDRIRSQGNEANHEIVIASRQTAEELMTFTAMLLRLSFELPSLLPPLPGP